MEAKLGRLAKVIAHTAGRGGVSETLGQTSQRGWLISTLAHPGGSGGADRAAGQGIDGVAIIGAARMAESCA